ncbi:MAG: DUF4435 domain-containing protein [Eggerthellaceae bacterium]
MLSQADLESITRTAERATKALTAMAEITTAIDSKKDDLVKLKTSADYSITPDDMFPIQHVAKRLDVLISAIQNLPSVGLEVSENFSSFIRNEFVAYNWEGDFYTQDYCRERIFSFLDRNDLQIMSPEDGEALQWIRSIPTHYLSIVCNIETKVNALSIFQKIKGISGNIVMIGANGSGKSTFSRQLRGKLSAESSLTILSAQHLLAYSPEQNISASSQELKKVHDYQNQDKLSYDQQSMGSIGSEMNQLVSALISLHCKDALAYHRARGKCAEESTLLERAIRIWKSLIKDRDITLSENILTISTSEGIEYAFNNLSDGEKAVFFYVGHVLLAKDNSYIIVDEPENHLHVSICSYLWDTLEKERSDCSFIYLTHDLDFAASRINSTILWNEGFTPPSNWQFEILDSVDDMPDALMLSLVGSKKKICFCEGDDKGSIDYRLYSSLFPSYNIVPAGGHEQVIAFTRAYNKNPQIFHHKAIGIIDEDCHSKEQINSWTKDSIFTLRASEVENVLCDEELLDAAIERFCAGKEAKQLFLDSFWRKIQEKKESQALLFTKSSLNESFRSNCLKDSTNIDDLQNELKATFSANEILQKYRERLNLIEASLESKDYEQALRITFLKKALTREIANKNIVNNYEDRIIDLLRRSEDLAELIRSKYLPNIPLPEKQE